MSRFLAALTISLLTAALVVVAVPSAAFADGTRDKQWYADALDLDKAHELSQGAGVTIGMIDSGVDATHPDVKGNVKAGRDFGSSKDRGLHDSDGHGTGMASILVAHGHGKGDADGVMGMAPKATVISVGIDCDKDSPCDSSGNYINDAIKWLVGQKVDVISISVTALDYTTDGVEYATKHKVPVVVAAGNTVDDKGKPVKRMEWPSNAPGVIPVTGTTKTGTFWSGSLTLHGADPQLKFGVSAPAADLIHAKKGGGYGTDSGTSGAAPIVAGTLALIKSAYPKLDYTTWIARMIETVDDKGPKGYDDKYGNGIVNPYKALTADIDFKDEFSHIKSKASDRLPLDEQGKDAGGSGSGHKKSSGDAALTATGGGALPLVLTVVGVVVLLVVAAITIAVIRRRSRTRILERLTPLADPATQPGPPD